MLDETQQETQQLLAVSEAEQTLAVAFGRLLNDDAKLLDESAAPAGGLTLLYEVGNLMWAVLYVDLLLQSCFQERLACTGYQATLCHAVLKWSLAVIVLSQVCSTADGAHRLLLTSTTVHTLQGDELAAAACGLTTGYVHGNSTAVHTTGSTPSVLEDPAFPGKHQCSSIAASRLLPGSTKDMSAQDVDLVEPHILHLLQFEAQAGAGRQQDSAEGPGQQEGDSQADIRRKLQQAQLKVSCVEEKGTCSHCLKWCCLWCRLGCQSGIRSKPRSVKAAPGSVTP